jgi:hypothetical protein
MPKLLIRSREYRKADFKIDFPHIEEPDLTQIKEALDQKLEELLQYEIVDRDIKHATKSICETFPERHWFITWNATTTESKLLQFQYVLPLEEDETSDFRQSMAQFINYILELSEVKLIQGSNISMDILVSHLFHCISILQDEKKNVHIPTIVETLQQQEMETFLEREIPLKYEEVFSDEKGQNLEELKEIHEQVKQEVISFYEQQCLSKNLSNWIVERNRESLLLVIETCFLVPQERLRERLSQRIRDLKELSDADHKQQVELGITMQQMENQIQNISNQISKVQSETAQSDLLLKQALEKRDHSMNEYNQSKNSSSSSFCSIL